MPLNYAHVRQFFAEHLAAELNKDPEARGRIESASFHTAQWIWEQGYNEGRRDAVNTLTPDEIREMGAEVIRP